MSSPLHRTILLHVNLGKASAFNKSFSLSYHKKSGKLGLSDLYLDATLEELIRVSDSRIGFDPQQLEELVSSTKDRYDQLVEQKEKIEESRVNPFNLLKLFTNYRAARLCLAASKALYDETMSRSNQMARSVWRHLLESVPSEDMQPMEDAPPPDADVDGIAFTFEGPPDDTTNQQLLTALSTITSGVFESDQTASDVDSILSGYFTASESLTSLVSDSALEGISDTATPPVQSQITIVNNYFSTRGFIYAPNSVLTGPTMNFAGQGCSGAVNHSTIPSGPP